MSGNACRKPSAMMWIIAVRDNETHQVPVLRAMTEHEETTMAAFFGAMRAQYPPPRYEINMGRAESVAMFVRVYPRFKAART